MSNKITAGILLPAGTAVMPEQIFVEDYKSIQSYVGGCFDVVTADLGKEDISFVGYVHDEGLLLDLEFNYIASALFSRELRGDCVVVWGLNSENEYDGENHDIPTDMVHWLNRELMGTVAVSYSQSAILAAFCEIAVELELYGEEEVLQKSNEFYESARNRTDRTEVVNFFVNLIETVITVDELQDDVIKDAGSDMIAMLQKGLKK